jgi:hypothetical protein
MAFQQVFWRINKTGNIYVMMVCAQSAFLNTLARVLATNTCCLTQTILKYLRLEVHVSCSLTLIFSAS